MQGVATYYVMYKLVSIHIRNPNWGACKGIKEQVDTVFRKEDKKIICVSTLHPAAKA